LELDSDIPVLTESEGLQILKVTGVSIGLISEIADSLNPALFKTKDWIQVIRAWKPENIETGRYFNGESLFLAFCRTVATDIFGRLRYSSFRRESTRWRLIEYTFREIFAGRIKQDIHHKILAAIERAMYRTRFARLSSGHIALVPGASENGDNICVLTGSSTPMGLRKEFPTASYAP
jgi:hypothetical protein